MKSHIILLTTTILPFTLAAPIINPLNLNPRQIIKHIGYGNPGDEGAKYTPLPPPPPPAPATGVDSTANASGGTDAGTGTDPDRPEQEGGKHGGAMGAFAGNAGHA